MTVNLTKENKDRNKKKIQMKPTHFNYIVVIVFTALTNALGGSPFAQRLFHAFNSYSKYFFAWIVQIWKSNLRKSY